IAGLAKRAQRLVAELAPICRRTDHRHGLHASNHATEAREHGSAGARSSPGSLPNGFAVAELLRVSLLQWLQCRLVRRSILPLLLLAALSFVASIGRGAIADSDEAFYAEAAREMVESGDWLTPHFNYELRFQKPILYYWLAAGVD